MRQKHFVSKKRMENPKKCIEKLRFVESFINYALLAFRFPLKALVRKEMANEIKWSQYSGFFLSNHNFGWCYDKFCFSFDIILCFRLLFISFRRQRFSSLMNRIIVCVCVHCIGCDAQVRFIRTRDYMDYVINSSILFTSPWVFLCIHLNCT